MSISFALTRTVDLFDLEFDDLDEVGLGERVEDDQVVEAVDELRFEDLLRFVENLVAHHFVVALVF